MGNSYPVATSTRTNRADELTKTVTSVFDAAFQDLHRLRANVEELYRRRALPDSAALGELRPAVIDTLGGPRDLIVGTGFIAGPGALSDAELGAEWWKSQRDTRPVRLQLQLDRAADDYLDFPRLPWFVVPRDRSVDHITGPYVDYVCTDEYSLTLSSPVRAGGRFLGVVGADIYVRALEVSLFPELREFDARAVLVNSHGRVIVSNSVRQTTGSMIRNQVLLGAIADGTEVPGYALHPCGDHPITLIVDHRG
jgi:hypothetical protein